MKVFISWSGNDSKQVAQLLAEWIPDVLQGLEPWFSGDDIEKGALWMNDIGDKLKEITVGILCLTRSNIDAPWILFEAGALSKGLTKSRVCPLLIDLSHKDLKPPLASFNVTIPTRDDMLNLIKTINAQMAEKGLPEVRVEKAFDVWWGGFEKKFTAIVKGFKPTKAVKERSVEDMVPEILELARSIQANVQMQRTAFQAGSTPSPSGFMFYGQPDGSDIYSRAILARLSAEKAVQPISGDVQDVMKKHLQVQPLVPLPIQTDTSSSDY